MAKVKIEVEIEDEILHGVDELAKSWERPREEIISDALRDFVSEHYDTTWKEKGSLKKKKGPSYPGKIPESEYKPEQE